MPKQSSSIPEKDENGTPLTQPIQQPRGHHAKYEYEHGEYRRCHLCGTQPDHMLYNTEEVWFANLQDRAKHILECHQDNRIECERASLILGFESLWNQYSEKKEGPVPIPVLRGPSLKRKNEPEQPYQQQYAHQTEPKKFKQPILTKKRIGMVLLVILILYAIYVMYLLSLGYSF